MRLFSIAPALCFILTFIPRAHAASLAVDTGNADVASLVLLLICGIILGGVISVVRTRSRNEASK